MTSTVVIMAAGRGTRMKELATDRPKHLLPVRGRPFLEHTFDRLRQAGFTDIVVLIGHQAQAFAPYRDVGDIRLVEQTRFRERYGTGAAVESVKDAVGDRPFVVIAGDNLYSVTDLRAMRADSDRHRIGGYRTSQWQGMGILSHHPDGRLRRIVEKPDHFVGDLINASLYHFTPDIFALIEQLQPSPRGEYEITDAINAAAAKTIVDVVELQERWLDLTAPSDIPKIEAALADPNEPSAYAD